ncbi:glycoside hydrolase family 2 protein [Kouleothrix sp.]|uniref:glycoside hydrolase family 2 protein n=1 Tax=Kouleothrix sp. TaxID=2779161 RepID=UPI003919C125
MPDLFAAPIAVAGPWELRRDGETTWQPALVPGCWEQLGRPKDDAGPFWYRTTFSLPPAWAGRRIWLRFGGVSYHCELFVNGQPAGEHTGLWDAFTVEITGAANIGGANELLARVEKPASLTAGPDSAAAPGRFHLRETLAGFLPYVWGHCFGGIWQDVELFATGAVCFDDVLVRAAANGTATIVAATSAPADVALEIRDPDGRVVAAKHAKSAKNEAAASSAPVAAEHVAHFALSISQPQPWSPEAPALYTARLTIANGDERVVRFGLRTLRAEGSTLTLNGQPIYPRMALSWGWYPEALHSNPGPARVSADFARLKALGFNGVKLCLWFPPQYYFDLADELGMLLWVELPMWLPRPSAFFRQQAPREYERLMRQARSHPAAILYTLGCELSRAADAALLAPLFALAKAHAGDALVRDNSGSGEAYGGLLNEFAEFYDYHFYSELQHFRSLLDYFAPRGRPPQPWLFGEFCDYDTFREPSGHDQEPGWQAQAAPPAQTMLDARLPGSSQPWWTSGDPAVNPQGARWQMDAPHHAARLRASGMGARAAELTRRSYAQGLWQRKYTIEQARLFREIGGYVVTGEADTPISTAGMWDAHDRLKFELAAFRGFNADTVLLLGWDRRRDWVAGGDRAAPWDAFGYPAGAAVRAHLIAAHYGAAQGHAHLRWQVAFAGEPPFAAGQHATAFALAPGDLRELAVAEFAAPPMAAPRQATLAAEFEVGTGGEPARNSWPLWFFPRNPWAGARDIALYDPLGQLSGFEQIAPGIDKGRTTNDAVALSASLILHPSSSVVIATAWSPELRAWIDRGGRAILLQPGSAPAGPLPVAALPFWREALRLAEPHPAWGDFPLDDALAMQLFGCAADHALDMSRHAGEWRPILRRLDTRTMHLHEYAAELRWGQGRLIASTLRFEGGQGVQPLGIARNTAAAYLLWCWASYLQRC